MKLLYLLCLCAIVVSSWESNAPTTKPTLYLLSVLPYPDTPGVNRVVGTAGSSFALAAAIAVEAINNRTDILGGYNLALIRGESGCSVTTLNVTWKTFVDEVFYRQNDRLPNGNVVGIVGPTCSDAALTISNQIARPKVSLIEITTASSENLSNRTSFFNTFSISGSSDIHANALLALMRMNSWNSVAVVYDASHNVFSTLFSSFSNKVKAANFTMTSADAGTEIDLEDLNLRRTRIIFLFTGPRYRQQFLCLAANYSRLNIMYDQYQFILLTNTIDTVISANVTFRHNQRTIFCDVEKMKQVVEGAIILRHQNRPVDLDMETHAGMSYNEFLLRYNTLAQKENVSGPINSGSPIYFDAVWSLALALNNTNANLSEYSFREPNTTDSVREELLSLSYRGVSGWINFNRSTGFTNRNLDILQVGNASMTLLEYYNSSNDSIVKYNRNRSVHYIKGTFDNYTYASLPIGITLMVITLVCVVILVCLQVLSVTHSKYHSVKATSPRITHTAYVGCYFLALAIAFYIIGRSFRVSADQQCHYIHAFNCLLVLGQVLLYATLVVRMFRIYRIFVCYLHPGRFIADGYLISFVLLVTCALVPPLICWGFDVLPESYHVPLLRNCEVDVWVQCLYKSDNRGNRYLIWLVVLLSYSWLFALVACGLGLLSVEKVKLKDFQISSVICLCVMLLLEIPLLITFLVVVGATPYDQDISQTDFDLIFMARGLIPVVALCLCVLLFFLPPFYPLIKEKCQTFFTGRRHANIHLHLHRVQTKL